MFGTNKKQEPSADPRVQTVLNIVMTALNTANDMLGDLLDTFTTAIPGPKDSLIATALKPAISSYLDGTGTAQEVEIDTTAKTARITLNMRGEERSVEILVHRYSIEKGAVSVELVVHDWSSPTHEWIATIAKKFNPEIRIEIPGPYSAFSTVF